VSWTLIPAQYQNTNSKIGLYQLNNASSPLYAQMTMFQCGVTTAQLAAGSCQFPLSRNLVQGPYELRYYGYSSSTGYRLIGTSSGMQIQVPTPVPTNTPTATPIPPSATPTP
jgi:hypothetical protein